MSAPASSRDESPVFFRAGDETLFGILTDPTVPPLGLAMVVLPGGSTPLTTDRNRFSVRLCRRMADQGCHALRFDYHGAGESTGSLEKIDLARPFVPDVQAATGWVRDQGIEDYVFVGSCFGARTALSSAQAIPEVRGVVLVSVPVSDSAMGEGPSDRAAVRWSFWTYLRRTFRPRTLRGLFDPRRRAVYAKFLRAKWRAMFGRPPRGGEATEIPVGFASRAFLEPLAALVDRDVPVLLLFGTDEPYYADFERARAGSLAALLERAGPLIEIRTLPGVVHGFTSTAIQDAVIDEVTGWLSRFGERGGTRPVAATSDGMPRV